MIGGRDIKDIAFNVNDNVLEDNSFWRHRLHYGDFSASSDWNDQLHRRFLVRGEYDFNANTTLSQQTSRNTVEQCHNSSQECIPVFSFLL